MERQLPGMVRWNLASDKNVALDIFNQKVADASVSRFQHLSFNLLGH